MFLRGEGEGKEVSDRAEGRIHDSEKVRGHEDLSAN